MRHPEIMLKYSGPSHGVRILKNLMDRAIGEGQTSLPRCSVLSSTISETDAVLSQDRAAIRELPYVLSGMIDHPIYWEVDEATAAALIRTDAPRDPQLRGMRLPHETIWVGLPPLFSIFHRDTGTHRIEGVYIAEDWMPSRQKLYRLAGIPGLPQMGDLSEEDKSKIEKVFIDSVESKTPATEFLERCIMVVAVGESRTPYRVEKLRAPNGQAYELVNRDDALVSFWIFPEDPGREVAIEGNPGDLETQRFVTNLLMALQAGYLKDERVQPAVPKSPKKIKRAERKGTSFAPYSVIKLGSRAVGSTPSRSRRKSGAGTKDRVIRGYWNHYWVLEENLGDRNALEKRHRENKTPLCKVRMWVPPQIVGSPNVKTYLVKA